MMAEVLLLDDRASPVAVGAAHLALRNLPSKRRQRGLAACELHHAPSFLTDMIEVQDDWIGLTAVDTRSGAQILEEEEKISSSERAIGSRRPPSRFDAPRPDPRGGSATVAVCADEFAVLDFRLDAI